MRIFDCFKRFYKAVHLEGITDSGSYTEVNEGSLKVRNVNKPELRKPSVTLTDINAACAQLSLPHTPQEYGIEKEKGIENVTHSAVRKCIDEIGDNSSNSSPCSAHENNNSDTLGQHMVE